MGLLDSLFGGEQKTTTTYEPFSGQYKQWYESLYPYLYGKATTSSEYTGPVAGTINPTQTGAINLLTGYASNPTRDAYARGDYLDPTKNPYVTGIANQIKADTSESWGNMGNQINTAYNKSGFLNSSGRYKSLENAQKDLAKAESGALANLYNQSYQQNVNNMLSAQQGQQSAAQAMLGAGNTQYQVEDTAAQRAYQKYLSGQQLDQNEWATLLNYIAMGKNPTQTTTTTKEGGGLGNLIGGIAGGLDWNKIFGVKVE